MSSSSDGLPFLSLLLQNLCHFYTQTAEGQGIWGRSKKSCLHADYTSIKVKTKRKICPGQAVTHKPIDGAWTGLRAAQHEIAKGIMMCGHYPEGEEGKGVSGRGELVFRCCAQRRDMGVQVRESSKALEISAL